MILLSWGMWSHQSLRKQNSGGQGLEGTAPGSCPAGVDSQPYRMRRRRGLSPRPAVCSSQLPCRALKHSQEGKCAVTSFYHNLKGRVRYILYIIMDGVLKVFWGFFWVSTVVFRVELAPSLSCSCEGLFDRRLIYLTVQLLGVSISQ